MKQWGGGRFERGQRELAVGGRWGGGVATIGSMPMSKKTKKRKARLRRSKANHGKRPNMGRG